MIGELLLSAAVAVVPDEVELAAKLPEVFARSAAHYRALDAVATPLMRDSAGGLRIPHGVVRGNAGKIELDMRSIFWWTAGHYPGSLWYLYEISGDAFFRERAKAWTEVLEPVKTVSKHDVGFMIFCSYGNAARIERTDRYDAILMTAANTLCGRYDDGMGLIRSWGQVSDRNEFLVIPDNLMNLELLMWAGRHGDKRSVEIAKSHADITSRHHFDREGGCHHVLNYDQRHGFRGRVQEIRRGQGLSCETAWSRGQSWSIYGYTMMYRETRERRYLDFAQKLADYAIGHPNMPEDGIPYWDYGAREEERDSSAGAIMASALLELAGFVGSEKGADYLSFAVKQLRSLVSDAYFSRGDEIGHFLLKHGVGHKPAGSEIDTPLNYGDYYFLEALLRFKERGWALQNACKRGA